MSNTHLLSESDGELFARHGFAPYDLRDCREKGFVLGRTEAVRGEMGRPVAKIAKVESCALNAHVSPQNQVLPTFSGWA
ncbi:MAG: hypothetical protein NVSMB38_42760 [Ktedonobacteraceae bacterium]